MRLSEWRANAPARDAVGPKVNAVVDPVLAALGADPDPHGWIAWGEEPASRFTVFVPTDPGLISCFVRVAVPGEGPRATTKLVRWNRVTIGELAVETQGGHRMLSFQLESQVLRGVDTEADGVAAFALRVIAAIDGRPLPAIEERGPGRKGPATGGARAPGRSGAIPPKGPSKGGVVRPSKGAVAPAGSKATTTPSSRNAGVVPARAKARSDAGR
jgi:hypothetical protein